MKLRNFAPHSVSLGATVHIRDVQSGERDAYTLTLPHSADIRLHSISSASPLGRALFGRRPGEIVEVNAPGGLFRYEIEAVEPAATVRPGSLTGPHSTAPV